MVVACTPDPVWWRDAAGVRHDFNGSDVVAGAPRGAMMPPTRRIEDLVPEMAGAVLRSIDHGPREVSVPLSFVVPEGTEVKTVLRAWCQRLNVLAGEGFLGFGEPGDERELRCAYQDGLTVEEAAQAGRAPARVQPAIVVFRAADPYWQDSADTTVPFPYTSAPTPFFPILPVELSSSNVGGTVTISNDGDVETWPVWTIAGPGTDVTLTNLLTGESFYTPTLFSAGDTLVVDTRPGAKVATLNGSRLPWAVGSALWALQPGAQDVEIAVGLARPTTLVTLSYRRRYLTR